MKGNEVCFILTYAYTIYIYIYICIYIYVCIYDYMLI